MEIVLVTGGSGLVGKAIERINNNFIFMSSKDCDLTNYEQTYNYFDKIRPTKVIHLAAYVGGLFKNMNYKVDMLEKNLIINHNVLKCCYLFGVKKVVSCLSTCIFPDNTTYPIDETMLHNGPPHYSNDAYAHAKRILEIHSRAYREQYGCNFICVIPTNIYGIHDNFHLEDAHVIPALIHKCYNAKKYNKDFIVAGSGLPLRQFIHCDDLAYLICWVMGNYNEDIILAPMEEISIGYIANLIANEFDKKVIFDTTKPDGQYKKTASNKKLLKLIDYNFKNIKEGIKETCTWFIENYDHVRK